jgi:hypothetical protein
MKINKFYAYLAGGTLIFILAVQLFGVYAEYEAHQDYTHWRNALHARMIVEAR